MKRLLILATAAAALMTSGCITVIDADSDDTAWHGNNAQPFDEARAQCRADNHGRHVEDAFRDCMAAKGWTRS
ncbi:hypothetical protein [Brevundimonas sp.]|uniref:hypothetical protein n=1 Tax=Brevundimonas sp. TaxID=1871086 RepID=UPI003D0FCD3E